MQNIQKVPNNFAAVSRALVLFTFYVNTCQHFANPILNNIHTNTIKRLWATKRAYLRQVNPQAFFDDHLAIALLDANVFERGEGKIHGGVTSMFHKCNNEMRYVTIMQHFMSYVMV
eukprot:TRINITY_DN3344_c0_g2_i1.p3 TRINITY_DN3344_c0_g2~~TRINITY_DN3344_c0_g2_i1.p3  ORF type:complete len:116 (+),score=3.18 TRINITY_DN3344_c0_g2_i1:193-540(+)